MDGNSNEAVADIVKELRTLGRRDEKSTDSIEAAAKMEREATREKSSQVGNEAAMREALGEISRKIWESIDPFCNDDCCKPKRELAKIADAAIASTPRNCDVLSKAEVLEMLKDRSFSKEDTIEWLYSKAKGGAEWMV